MKKLLIVISVFISVASAAQFPTVTIPGSEERTINSSIVTGQEYKLQIMLPAGYNNGNKKYPVVYVMDAQWDFPLVAALYGQQYFDGFIPALIIVGVTWGGNHPNPDSLRARDYTPTNDKRLSQSGGAEKFLSVLQKEIFPFIEANYSADKTDRTLMGCSLGGLFTLYTLFTHPQLFQRYIAASPAFGWDNGVINTYEKKYFESSNAPSAKLFMCIGGVERSVPGFESLSKRMEGRKYTSLSMQSRVLQNTGHSGTKGEGYARGLQYVFERPSLILPASVMDAYTGQYQLPDKNIIEIKTENAQPVLYVSAGNKFLLQAASELELYTKAEFLNLKFKKNASGAITGFDMEQYGKTQYATKIK